MNTSISWKAIIKTNNIINAPTGPTGYNGIMGYMGSTGPTGYMGDLGYNGIRGHTGLNGDTGPTGPTGYDGYHGIDGVTGFMGATGILGSTGATGATGATGPCGPTGLTNNPIILLNSSPLNDLETNYDYILNTNNTLLNKITMRVLPSKNNIMCMNRENYELNCNEPYNQLMSIKPKPIRMLEEYVKHSSNYVFTHNNKTSIPLCTFFMVCSNIGDVIILYDINGYVYYSNNYGIDFIEYRVTTAIPISYISADALCKHIYCVSSTRLIESFDNGKTFIGLINAGTRNFTAVECTSDGLIVVASVNGDYIYKSSGSYGTSGWTALTNSGQRAWLKIKISSSGDKIIGYIADGSVYMSLDSGITWNMITTIGAGVKRLIATSELLDKIWIIGDNSYYSINSGATWNVISSTQSWTICSLSRDGTTSIYYDSSQKKIYKSTDNHNNFIDITPLNLNISNYIDVIQNMNGNTLYVSTISNKVNWDENENVDYYSYKYQLSLCKNSEWIHFNNSIQYPQTTNIIMNKLSTICGGLYCTYNGSTLIALIRNEIPCISYDSGMTFNQLNFTLSDIATALNAGTITTCFYKIAISDKGNDIIIGCQTNNLKAGLYTSSNYGKTFTKPPITQINSAYPVCDLNFAKKGETFIFSANAKLFIAKNNPFTYTVITGVNIPDPDPVNAIITSCLISNDTYYIYIFIFNTDGFYRLYKYEDLVYSEITPLLQDKPLNSIDISGNGQYIILCYYNTLAYISNNYGANFTTIAGTSSISTCVSISDSGKIMCIVMPYQYPLISLDYGVTWTTLTEQGKYDWIKCKVSPDESKIYLFNNYGYMEKGTIVYNIDYKGVTGTQIKAYMGADIELLTDIDIPFTSSSNDLSLIDSSMTHPLLITNGNVSLI